MLHSGSNSIFLFKINVVVHAIYFFVQQDDIRSWSVEHKTTINMKRIAPPPLLLPHMLIKWKQYGLVGVILKNIHQFKLCILERDTEFDPVHQSPTHASVLCNLQWVNRELYG